VTGFSPPPVFTCFFKEIYCTDSIYKVYKDKLQNFNKYVLYGISEMNNMYINIGVNNGSDKGTEKHCGFS